MQAQMQAQAQAQALTDKPSCRRGDEAPEEAELRVNDLSVCKGHGSKGTGRMGSGKTPLTPWQSLPPLICSFSFCALDILLSSLVLPASFQKEEDDKSVLICLMVSFPSLLLVS